jgi:DNA-binding SARP family transcriptional activator
VQVCRKALVRDPCRESFHWALMKYLVRLGRPDWAATQFRHCQEVLDRELGVEPMPEMQRLYRQIRKGGECPPDTLTAYSPHKPSTPAGSRTHAGLR